jgi:hypothetical protein
VKISFEGKTIHDVLEEMQSVLALYSKAPAAAAAAVAAPAPAPDLVANALTDIVPVDKPVDKAVEKPVKPERTEKQKANDERLRVAALAKMAAKKAKKAEPADAPLFDEPQAPVDPAEVVKIRQKTIEDLQSAYANGHQAEVFELLSRFGNGAKSFRELPPEAFMPISEAIAKGALTSIRTSILRS